MILGIHQPNFMPWNPFFEKIINSDKFVLLTHCQFQKNKHQNRFNIGEKWFTMSVSHGMENIAVKRYHNCIYDWKMIKKKLPEYKNVLNLFDECISSSLSETNINIIKKICNLLEIKTELLLDYPTNLLSSDRLVDICLYYDCDTYLSGSSGKNYLDLSKFESKGIKVVFHDANIKAPIVNILKEKLSV